MNINIFEYYLSTDNSMIKACIDKDLDLCKKIYSEKPYMLRKKNINQRTPLLTSCCKGYLDICEWLYDNGANEDVMEKDKQGHYPLYSACREGHLHIIKWLFEKGVKDIIEPDFMNQKPIWFICNHNYINLDIRCDIALYFLERDIYIDNNKSICKNIYKYIQNNDFKDNISFFVNKKISELNIKNKEANLLIERIKKKYNLENILIKIKDYSETDSFIHSFIHLKNLLSFKNNKII